jgi:hypothetical protein
MSDIVSTYEELADREDTLGLLQMRDRFLILAADAALSLGQDTRAEKLRARLIQHNPHHLLKPYSTLADALTSSDVFSYVADLRHAYPPEEAERLLEELRLGKSSGADPLPRDRNDEPEIYPLPVPAREPAPPTDEFDAAAGVAAPPPRIRHIESPKEETSPADEVFPFPTVAPPPRRSGPREPEDTDGVSALSRWVGTTLFVALLLAGLALAGYTLARPFLTF